MKVGKVWVEFSPTGNACESDVKSGTATPEQLAQKVLIGLGDWPDSASTALTCEEARNLARILNGLADRGGLKNG